MNKCHTTITWINDSAPAINQTHLNQYDGELDTLDDRVITLDTTKAAQSDLLTALANVTYNTSTGVFTFTWKNGTSYTVDLNIEKIPVSFSMDANGVITMITADGTTYTADVSSILKLYTFVDSSTIGFSVTQNGNNYTVTANVVDGSITSAKLQPDYLADITAQANAASGSASAANTSALKAEGFAVGEQNGSAVSSDSPYYENNAKHYADEAADLVAGLLEAYGISVNQGVLIFGSAFEDSFSVAVVGTQLQISQIS